MPLFYISVQLGQLIRLNNRIMEAEAPLLFPWREELCPALVPLITPSLCYCNVTLFGEKRTTHISRTKCNISSDCWITRRETIHSKRFSEKQPEEETQSCWHISIMIEFDANSKKIIIRNAESCCFTWYALTHCDEYFMSNLTQNKGSGIGHKLCLNGSTGEVILYLKYWKVMRRGTCKSNWNTF